MPESINDSSLQKTMYEIVSWDPYAQKSAKTTYFKSKDEQQAFLDRFAESNSAVAREYLGREDGRLFYEEIPDLPQEKVSTEELLRASLLFYGRTIQLLDTQNTQLQNKLEKLEAALEAEKNKGLLQHIKGLIRNSISKKS